MLARCVVTLCLAQNAIASDETTLFEAYQQAKTAAPDLALARYQVDSTEAKYSLARAKILPQASLFGQWSENEVVYDSGSSFPDRTYPGERYGIQFKQALLNVADGLEMLRSDLIFDQAQQELAVAEQLLLVQLTNQYMNALLANLFLEQLNAELEALLTQVDEAKALYEKSLLPVTQVLELQTRTESLRADIIKAEVDTLVSQEQIFYLTGARFKLRKSAAAISLINRISSADEAAQLALANNPAVEAAELAVSAAKRAVEREKGSWIPNVDLSFNYQHSDVGFDNTSSPPRDTSTVAIGFNYPIFQGGAGLARVRVAWAEFYSAQTMLSARKNEVELQARSSWLSFEANARRVAASRQAVNTARVTVDASRRGVRAGVSRVTDVLVSLSQLTSAQRDFEAARFQLVMAWLQLELAIGTNPDVVAAELSGAFHGYR